MRAAAAWGARVALSVFRGGGPRAPGGGPGVRGVPWEAHAGSWGVRGGRPRGGPLGEGVSHGSSVGKIGVSRGGTGESPGCAREARGEARDGLGVSLGRLGRLHRAVDAGWSLGRAWAGSWGSGHPLCIPAMLRLSVLLFGPTGFRPMGSCFWPCCSTHLWGSACSSCASSLAYTSFWSAVPYLTACCDGA